MAKFHRKQSKRMTCRKKYGIKRKVAEHNRKSRKQKKLDIKKKIKDLGIPNSLPFKDKILEEAEQRRQKAVELKQLQKEGRLKQHIENRGLTELRESADARNSKFQHKIPSKVEVNKAHKSHYKEFKKVIDAADIILEVLDARDPLGSRCPQVEEAVISAGAEKRLVLVLNKIDLIPRSNIEKWVKYLRQEFPTIAFKASTQSQRENLSQCKVAPVHISEKLQLSRKCIGASSLMKLLGNYCRNNNILTSVSVGVVGFPNVGKSSIINSLKRARTCTVGATPGVTKHLQEIIIDKHIRLLDSPGVVLAKEGSASLALKNAVKIETLADVITPAEDIIKRASKEQLMLHYCIPDFNSPSELLALLAKKMGRFRKGGIPDPEQGARKLLIDWNMGKIKYYTHPPETHELPIHISSEYVSEMGKAFNLDDLDDDMELDMIPNFLPSEAVLVQSDGLSSGVMLEDTQMEVVDPLPSTTEVKVNLEPKKEKKIPVPIENEIGEEAQQNRKMKKSFKKMRKNKKKAEKRATALSESMETALTFGSDSD